MMKEHKEKAKTMSKKQHASFWNYTGNHHGGKDCARKDPHGFGIDLVSFVAYCAENGEFRSNELNRADIHVKHGANDGFGKEVKVAATKETWEAAKQDYLESQKLYAE